MERDKKINNAFYDTLHNAWFEEDAHPIALLRAENRVRNPWIISTIAKYKRAKVDVLDIGCGGGLLTHPLAREGHRVTGIDLSASSLEIARERDSTGRVVYLRAPAEQLPFPSDHFDVVCAMDLLEHVEQPARVIQEASRVLKRGGLFFFHTFNRTWWSWLSVIKGVEWYVPNAPRNMHVYPLFITPEELTSLCLTHELKVNTIKGLCPVIASTAFWKMVFTRKVPQDFRFAFNSSLKAGYIGYAVKSA